MPEGRGLLSRVQSLTTSGARAVEPFRIDGETYLAVPQLAADVEGNPHGIDGGASDVPVIVYKLETEGFAEWCRLDVPGAEDVEFFEIGGHRFLAVASIRSGRGPYELNVVSVVYQWSGRTFERFQEIPTFAAKQWRSFRIGDRHFLALAQGVVAEGVKPRHDPESTIFEWDGRQFRPFQSVESAWGYNWLHFCIGGGDFLAYADHVKPSRVLGWTGEKFEERQAFEGEGGRAFAAFAVEGQHFLAFARLAGDTVLHRWDDGRFVPHQTLSGPGGREFAVLDRPGGPYLFQVNFLTGRRDFPKTDLESYVYRWVAGRMERVETFATRGATDVAVFDHGGHTWVAVSESLTPELRFRTDSHVYRFEG